MQGLLCQPLTISSCQYNPDSQSLQEEQMIYWEIFLVSPGFSCVVSLQVREKGTQAIKSKSDVLIHP